MGEIANEEGEGVGPAEEVTKSCAENNVRPKGVEDATVFGKKGYYFSDETTPLIYFTMGFVDVRKDTAKENEDGYNGGISFRCE